ncbi:hypothetical protein [Streptomyces sp. NPDC006971]|uniref:hypothetical protein n=1 Tax=Streptomyces sp. NPDC006971 TaxID=3154784 RepID=UPI0033DA4CDE
MLGPPDRQVLGGDDAVRAARRLAAVDERSAVAGWDDGVFEASRADGAVLVEGAVVELAEPDRQAGALDQAVLDEDVALLGFPAGVEGFGFLADGGPGGISSRPVVCRRNTRVKPKANFAPDSSIRSWTDYPAKAA